MSVGKILLVEDKPDDVILTKRALKKSEISLDVVIAQDGVEALEYLRKEGEYSENDDPLPIFTLLDLKMPRMGGLAFLKHIREDPLLRLIPVVVLTSSREHKDICECYNLGANSYIQKPVGFEEFVNMIQILSRYWIALNIGPRDVGDCE